MKAIRMMGPGDADVLKMVDLPQPVPAKGEVLVKVTAAGVNFMDIGVRRGDFWKEIADPKTPGVEGAGSIVTLGDGVEDFHINQRVAWIYAPGSYAEYVVIPTGSLVPVPEFIDDRTAAAVMMQGLTASHFATDFYAVKPGDIALVHSAAGGVGLILTQLIKARGGRVIARVSSQAKVEAVLAAGADQVIVDSGSNFSAEVLRLTDGEGVHVVYDGSGPVTFDGSLASLRRSGTFCWYGPVLGAPSSLNLLALPKSIKIGYATFFDHISTPDLLRSRSLKLFDMISNGALKITANTEYPLSAAAEAHRDIESRITIGKLLLIP